MGGVTVKRLQRILWVYFEVRKNALRNY